MVGEELEESCEEMENLVDSMKFAWKQTRGNETDYIKEQAYDGVYDAAIRLAIEAIQVAAMAKKEIKIAKPVAEKRASFLSCHDGIRNVVYTCEKCGKTVRKNDRYCYECGSYFGE